MTAIPAPCGYPENVLERELCELSNHYKHLIIQDPSRSSPWLPLGWLHPVYGLEAHFEVSLCGMATTGYSQQVARRDEGSGTGRHPGGRHMALRHMAGHKYL